LLVLNRLAQRIEVAFADAFVVLAQDEPEEYRPRQRLAEDLQQLSLDWADRWRGMVCLGVRVGSPKS
jgi:hypothetical protein